MTEAIVACASWRIHYSVQGSGPALILLHGGLPGSNGASNFQHNIAALSQRFTTYAIDFPGWGRSSKNLMPPGEWRNPLEEGGRAVAAFMDTLGIEHAHVLGSSFGGSAALHLAMAQPHKVDRLVLVAPGGGLVPGRSEPVPALVKLLSYYQGQGPSLDKLTSLVHHLVLDKTLLQSQWLQAIFDASRDPETIANPPLRLPPGYVPLPETALCNDSRLATLASPVLFIWGRDDEMQPVECLPSFRAIPRQDALLLGRCGHWPHRERASVFNELVGWYLTRGE